MDDHRDDDTAGNPTESRLYLESDLIDQSICPILFQEESTEFRVLQLTTEREFDSLQAALQAHLEPIRDLSAAAVVMLTPDAEREMAETTVGESTPLYGLKVDPQDLTGISIAFSRILEDWSEVSSPVRICLRGAESLFAYHSGDLVYRFLNTILATLQGAGARVHMHLQPSVTDDRTLTMVKSLFDRIVGPDEPRPSRTRPEQATPGEPTPSGESGATGQTSADSFSEGRGTTSMTAAEIDAFLEANGHGILAFDADSPYAIPQSYGYDSTDRVAYFQLGMFDGSEKRERLADSAAVSLVVMRYQQPDHWRSVIVDGTLSRLPDHDVPDSGALEAFHAAELASVDVFLQDPSDATFEWFVLEPAAFSGRKSAGLP